MYNSRNDRNDRGPSSWGGPKKFGGPKPWDRGGDRGGRGGDREDREMFKATCSECGDMCQVPFRPRDGRPVFCNNCFKKDGDTGGAPSFERRERPSFDAKPSRDFGFRDDRAPERPRAESNGGGNQDQFKALNSKLDTLIKMLSTIIPAPKEHVVKPAEAKAEVKGAKEAKKEDVVAEAPKKVAKKKAVAKAKK